MRSTFRSVSDALGERSVFVEQHKIGFNRDEESMARESDILRTSGSREVLSARYLID
jgi:hypothetical protein